MVTIWDIISALGTIVAAISIISAFVLYRIQKKDEYLSKVRESLQYLSNGIKELDSILNFELAYEMSFGLVYAEPTSSSVDALFVVCNNAIIDQNHDKDEVIRNIEKVLNIFGTSFTGPLATRYGSIVSEIMQFSTLFYPRYKGLFRFSTTSVRLMRNIFANYKKLLLDEEQVAKLLYDHMVEDCSVWDSVEEFKKVFLDCLISIAEYARRKHHQNDINQIVALVDLVYSRHIELTAKEWNKLARATRKLELLPFGKSGTITGELREAQKCFKTIFSHDDVVKYASLTQKIEDANT